MCTTSEGQQTHYLKKQNRTWIPEIGIIVHKYPDLSCPKSGLEKRNVYNLLGLYPHWQNDYWVCCSTWVTTSKTALLNSVVTTANWLLRWQIQLTTGAVWGKKNKKQKKKKNKNKEILKRQRKNNELWGVAKYKAVSEHWDSGVRGPLFRA